MKTEETVLVSLFDEHNESSLIAIDIYKPKKIIFVVEEKDNNMYLIFEEKLKMLFDNILVERYKVNNEVLDAETLLCKLKNYRVLVSITGGRRINSILLYKAAAKVKCKIIYIDVLNKYIYSLGNEVERENIEFKDFFIEDILATCGAEIIVDSTKLSNDNDIIDLSKKIYNNLNIWFKYKQKLYDNNLFIHDYNGDKLKINLELLDDNESNILYISLNYLKDLKMIHYKKNYNMIDVKFLNEYIKGFIFKSGTWLEVLIYNIVSEIREVDQVKNGVVFLWKEQNRIKNELDVIAVRDSVLICISCKDSEKYDEQALNELQVYSEKIGGENTVKILVATKKPAKKCVEERAKAMKINLIICDNNIDSLKNKLSEIINKSTIR